MISVKPAFFTRYTRFGISLFVCLALFCSPDELFGQFSKNRKPNIVFIMADDLGWQDVGFMGSKFFETPHLDKLAKNGLILSRSYMYPTCSPSRAALLTGKQSFRTGVYNVPVLEKKNPKQNVYSRWTVETKHRVYAEPLRENGYQLIHIGKWHIVGPNPAKELKQSPFQRKLKQPRTGDLSWLAEHKTPSIEKYYPTGRGFHKNVGGTWWGDPSRGHNKGYKSKSGGYKAPFANPFIEPKQTDHWLTDRLTDEAIQFINENKEKPFFVNLHFYAPHRPSVSGKEGRLEHYLKKQPDLKTGQGVKRKKEIAKYATMVESIDNNVQRIVKTLRELNLEENTILIFTSDNGHNGLQSVNKNLRGAKGMVYEGGIRVPTFFYWRGKIKHRVDSTPVCGLDFFPTFLELAKVSNYSETLDGKSLVPLIQAKNLPKRALFWHLASGYKHPACSVIRKGKWKLIQFLIDGKIELYNLEQDPKESQNLADTEKKIAQELTKQLQQWRKKNNAPLPKSSVLPF